MSLELKLDDKLLLGCGDGLKNGAIDEGSFKTPQRTVPSSRRFAIGTSPDYSHVVQLQKAIEELSQSQRSPIRRALTIAEITPTRTTIKTCFSGLTIKNNLKSSKNVYDAGRLVYGLLLLNAWRKRRRETAILVASIGGLETQNGKLELQINALHLLRAGESERRNEAVAQTQALHRKNEQTIKENEILLNEKSLLQHELNIFRKKLTEFQLELENTNNSLVSKQLEFENIEHLLVMEQKKIKRLRNEKRKLQEQELSKNREIIEYKNQVGDLQERVLNTELLLQDNIFSNNNYKREKNTLLEKLQAQRSTNETVSKENEKLKDYLNTVKKALEDEQNRPWWKNARELGADALHTLKVALYIMLPIVPNRNDI